MQHITTALNNKARKAATLIATVAAFVLVTAGIATAASAINTMTQAETRGDLLGTDSLEMSAATHNEDRNVMLVVDDGNASLYEIDLTNTGEIDTDETPRKITITGGTFDLEGIAWVPGTNNTYGVLDENNGNIYVMEIPVGATTISSANLIKTIPGEFSDSSDNGYGIEGIDTDNNFWYAVHERGHVYRYDNNGTRTGHINLTSHLNDASDIERLANGDFLILSHESQLILHITVQDWDAGTYSLNGSLNNLPLDQAEGLTNVGNHTIHVIGEKANSGSTTYARYTGNIETQVNSVEVGDVNCSGGKSDIADARMVAQISVGTSQQIQGCHNGDINKDGQTNIIDARMIMQCSVGLKNDLCPANG